MSIIALAMPLMASHKYDFVLNVKLQDAYNPNFEIQTEVRINKPFRIVTSNGAVKNTISGVLHSPQDGRYPLTLNIAEWISATQNGKETVKLNLELDKPWSGAAIQSTVFRRTVMLNRKP